AKKLDHLNRLIQVQRNIEMHAAMERAQLETQRVELLLQLQTAANALPYNITVGSGSLAPITPERPAAAAPIVSPQLPSLRAMIESVLQSAAPHGLSPRQIIGGMRTMGWPGTNKRSAYSMICIMCKNGRISRTDGRYYVAHCPVSLPSKLCGTP